jgi:hypothetical protein
MVAVYISRLVDNFHGEVETGILGLGITGTSVVTTDQAFCSNTKLTENVVMEYAAKRLLGCASKFGRITCLTSLTL